MDPDWDFVEKPSDDYFCIVTFALLLEPYQTQCCGRHLSVEAFERLRSKPCPICRTENFTAMKDMFHRRKVLSLKVRCTHKAEGCDWEGELGYLERHLSAEGQCLYEAVECPHFCGERVLRHDLEQHQSQHCPKRPFTCQYCNHVATYQEMTEHWPVCEKYPVSCPNGCGEKGIMQQHLERHLEEFCSLETIPCEFSYAGCGTRLQRHLMPAHMKERMEAHLSMVAQVSKEIPVLKESIQQQASQLKENGVEIKRQEDKIRQQEEQLKRQEEKIKRQGEQLEKQEDEINQQDGRLTQLISLLARDNDKLITPPVNFVMNDFEEHKRNSSEWYSPPFYSHIGGYKMILRVNANGHGSAKGTHTSVYIHLMKGDFDYRLKWPFSGDVTVQLKTPELTVYQEKFSLGKATFKCVSKPTEERNPWGMGSAKFMSHADLHARGYLKNNRLLFTVSEVS